jgi:probable F420-dependent oxidoreductase
MVLRETFGRVGLWTFHYDATPWQEARETLAEVEELGVGALWVPEAVGRNPFVHAALLLGASSRLAVATGIANIHARSPLATKSAWFALTEAFPDRFLLGLGVSHGPMVEGLLGHRYPAPLAAMSAHLDAVDAAPYLAAAPTTTPRRVLGALGPRMLDLAAARADGAHPYNVTPEHTAAARERLGPDAFLAPEQKVVLAADASEGRAAAREALGVYMGLPNYTNNLRRLGFGDDDLAGGGSDRLVDALVAWGDEAAIARRVREHFDAGADHVAVQVLTGYRTPGIPLDAWRRVVPAALAA